MTADGTRYVAEHAWLGGGDVATEVAIDVHDGRFVRVEPGGEPAPGAERLRGLVLPGLADGHSHAFHRALRGRTHGDRGTFWTWRERMYRVAGRLDPDTYLALARATFAESVLAGVTGVGEFHYLHHGPAGVPYADPNAFGHALVAAARDAGVRLTLLDACYLAGGIGEPTAGVQRRFDDGAVETWVGRVDALHAALGGAGDVRVGAAIHSVRAVPRDALPAVAGWARTVAAPLHVHLSEQPAENEACRAAYGVTPAQLLADAGALTDRTTAVHAIHLDERDVRLLGEAGASVCLCPTTERDLADGVGPVRRTLDAGAPLTLGADSRAVVDPFEEARTAELHLRLATLERGHLRTPELLQALTADGHASLGFDDAGRIAPGARADLVAVRLDSVRTAGAGIGHALDAAVFAATAADVTDVVVDGRRVVRDGAHVLGDVGALLREAIAPVIGGRG